MSNNIVQQSFFSRESLPLKKTHQEVISSIPQHQHRLQLTDNVVVIKQPPSKTNSTLQRVKPKKRAQLVEPKTAQSGQLDAASSHLGNVE